MFYLQTKTKNNYSKNNYVKNIERNDINGKETKT